MQETFASAQEQAAKITKKLKKTWAKLQDAKEQIEGNLLCFVTAYERQMKKMMPSVSVKSCSRFDFVARPILTVIEEHGRFTTGS